MSSTSTPAPGDEARQLLAAGIAAAKAGHREPARAMLLRVVEMDERNTAGWLWLSSVVDDLDDREVCLENVLALDPSHVAARRGLELIRQQKAARAAAPAGGEVPVAEGEPQPPRPEFLTEHPSPAAAILEPELRAAVATGAIASTPMPDTIPEAVTAAAGVAGAAAISPAISALGEVEQSAAPPAVSADVPELSGEYRCPYCGAQTQPAERRCPSCGGELWLSYRRREAGSYWLGIAMAFQGLGIIGLMFLISLVLASLAEKVKLSNPYALVPAYLGLSDALSPEARRVAFATLPRWQFFGLCLPLAWAVAVFVGLSSRLKVAFYAYLVDSMVVFVAGVAALFWPKPGPLVGMGAIIAAAIMFALTLAMEDDFFSNERRLVLALDRDVKSGLSYLQRGQFYAGRKMWAMAALHLQRAAGKMPEAIEPYLALAAAYSNMGKAELAELALAKARKIDAENAELRRIEAEMGEKQGDHEQDG